MQAIGQRTAAPYTGFDAVTPPPAPPAPAAPPEAIAHAAPADQPHQDGAPAPQARSFNNKGPLRVADTARPARQIPDWVPGQPPALAGLNTAQPAARLEPSEGRLRTPGGLASLMSAGTPLSALQNLPLPLTPIAAAATKAATPADPAAPAAPKADPMEIAALELLLAEPENQDMIRHFGGELKPLPTWTTVGQGIEARYGQDLGSRLNQLQTAQRAVETEFFNAMDAARQAKLPRLPQHPVSMRRNEPAPESGVPGWVYQPGDGHSHGRSPGWAFDPAAFARHYAQGDSPAQRAFAHLHGPEAVRFVPAPNTEAGGTNSWSLNGRTLVLGRKIDRREEGLTSDSVAASQNGTPDWAPSRVQRPDTQLDPDRITKLHNKEFVWFDPQLGWSTDDANIKQSGLDRAFPYIFAGAITAMTFGAGSTVAAGISSAAGGGTAGNLAVAAATGAVSNAALQLAANGRINFGQLLQSALSAGATAGIAHLPGVGQHLDGLAGTAAQRLMEYTGRASVQGALQAIMGGNFRDGMANSLLGSLAGEVGQQLNAHINQLQVTHGLNASEASALRLLSRAASSALRVAGSGDAAAGFASDFLGGIMGDALQNHPGTAATDAQAQGQTPQETAAPAHPGQTPAANSTVTVGRGDTLEQLARQHYGENWRAGLTALVAANPGLRTNRWGSPLITPGQTLNAPSLQGLSAEQLARLGHTGGQIIGRNSQGLNARAQWLAEQQALAAAQQAARQGQGMSPDEAYARYMAGGSRSDSYQRALGEDYRTPGHGVMARGASKKHAVPSLPSLHFFTDNPRP